LKLLSVGFKNFLSFGDTYTEVNLTNRGLVLLEGINEDSESFASNGSGKSSLISAIVYGLYGKLPDGTSGDEVVNDKTQKNTQVILKFEQGNNKLVIKRYRKDKKYKNKVILFINDADATKSSVKETNEYIQEIIKVDINTYLQSVVFGLGNIKTFTQATDKEKKEVLEDIANISIYKKAQLVAKDKSKEIESQKTDVENKLVTANNYIEAYQKSVDNYQEGTNKLLDSLKVIKSRVDNYENPDKLLNEIKASKDALSKKVKLLDQALDDLNKSNYLESDEYKDNKYIYNSMSSKIGSVTSEINRIDKDAEELKSRLIQITNQPDNELYCTYCGSKLDDVHRSKELKGIKDNLVTLISSKTTYSKELQELEAKKSDSEQVIKDLENKNKNFSGSNRKLSSARNKLTEDISSLNNKENDLISTKNQYDRDIEELGHLKEELAINSVDELKKQIKDEKEKVKKLNLLNAELEDKSYNYKKVIDMYSDKGVKSHVLDLVLPYINQRANYYLSILTDNTINIMLSTTTTSQKGNVSEKLSVEVNNINGSTEYKRNSTGERKRIDLSISLALQDYVMSRSGTKTNFIAYDEVFDGLDSVGIDRLMNLLKERVKEVPSIFVVSHNKDLKELFETSITIKKKRGISNIE